MQCESCGHESADVVAVQRIYLLDGAEGGPDAPPVTTVLDDIELWCFPCRSMYPHRTVAEGEDDDG